MSLESDLNRLERYYDALVREHGPRPEGAQWTSNDSQQRRFRVLADVGDLTTAKVLDLGCGTGALLDHLIVEHGFAGEYVGIDLAQAAVELARARHPEARFERRNVLETGVGERFDYVLLSGVFNNLLSDNWAFLRALSTTLFAATRQALAFNLLSTYVDYQDEGLWYADPGAVFDFCKTELSTAVTLRHDYEVKPGVVPFEYTVYVLRNDHELRRNYEA
jgi:SAM-dependent methyltransferase